MSDFVAPFVLSYTYKRSLGPVLSRFMTSLRDRRIEGVRTSTGRVLVPPSEYDPETGAAIEGWVDVGPEGCVESWCWVAQPEPSHPLQEPFAWALIRLDGADTSLVHCLKGVERTLVTGVRVRPVWAEERVGTMTDIRYFEVV
jgi:uncharacterized OB-fold protein